MKDFVLPLDDVTAKLGPATLGGKLYLVPSVITAGGINHVLREDYEVKPSRWPASSK